MGRNVWCVKYQYTAQSEAKCGEEPFWGDKWDKQETECKYQECSYNCPAMMTGTRVRDKVWQTTITIMTGSNKDNPVEREINCCRDRDYCNAANARGAGALRFATLLIALASGLLAVL